MIATVLTTPTREKGLLNKSLTMRTQAIGTKRRRKVPSMATPRSREEGPRATREKMELTKLTTMAKKTKTKGGGGRRACRH